MGFVLWAGGFYIFSDVDKPPYFDSYGVPPFRIQFLSHFFFRASLQAFAVMFFFTGASSVRAFSPSDLGC